MTNAEAIRIINQYDCNFYWTDGEKIPTEDLIEAFELAVKALDAQTPRVLTLEEVLSFGAIYMDEPSNPTCLIMLYCYKVERDYRYIFVDSDGDKIPYPSKEFNKTWRCWSSRPTDEQRRETPWEG